MKRFFQTIVIVLAAIIGAASPTYAQHTNYLGTVFIADTTTPANQLKINSDGSINVDGTMSGGTVNPATPANWGIGATGGSVPANGVLGMMSNAGTSVALQGDGTSGLWVNIKAGAGSGGTALTDQATFTQSTTSETPIGCLYNTSYAAGTSGKSTVVQCNPNGAVYVAAGAGAAVTMQSAATGNNNGTTLTTTGYQTALVNVNCSVTCSGGTTVNFEGTDSTGTYFPVAAFPVAGTSTAVTTATTSGQFYVPVAGYTTIRARISAYSAGTITITGTPVNGLDASLARVINANANVANNGDGVSASASAGPPVVNYGFLYNGTTWDRQRSGATTGAALTQPSSRYPSGATPITASATGTTAATTATLAGVSSHTTYICGLSIRANATAAATGNATVTGTITGTLNFTQWTAPLASGLGVTEQIFTPCVPASAADTAIAVVSAAPGSGGVVSSTAWGYQL